MILIPNILKRGMKFANTKISMEQALVCIAVFISLCIGFVYPQVKIEAKIDEYQPTRFHRNKKVKANKPDELHQIAKSINTFCPNLEKSQALHYAKIVSKESKVYGYDWELIVAIMKAESNFDIQAKSNKGAVGLMQLMPNTAEWISPKIKIEYSGVDSLYNPEYNVKLGVHYLSMMQNKFGDLDKALIAYNKGPKKLMIDLDNGEILDSEFLSRVKEYYINLKSFADNYPA